MLFKMINSNRHRDTITKFRRDSFIVSFGDATDFNEDKYIDWVREKSSKFPEGFVMAEENRELIGQLELSIREYEEKKIGYVHLYYLIPEYRGKGKSQALHDYATNFFVQNCVTEYHLRVAPSNAVAIAFYKKNGMEEMGPEKDGKVIRMRGKIYI